MINKSLDLTGQSLWKYPLASDTIDENDIDSLINWLRTNPRLTMGEITKQFERKWADLIGTNYSVYLNSGSSANLLMVYSLLNAGKLKNNKFLVPSCGWATTLSPFIQFGIEPIMVDAEDGNYNIDLNIVEDYLKRGDIDGFIFVHVLGVPHRRKELLYLKEKYGCYILEDSCASVGAKYDDESYVGTLGDMSSFSFYFGHQLSTIEGGFINTDDKFLYEELLKLRSHGWVKDIVNDEYRNDENFPFIFNEPGFNVRATDLQAYIGLAQIDKLDDWGRKRRNNFDLYQRLIENDYWKPDVDLNNFVSNFAYPIIHPNRDKIVKILQANKVEVRPLICGSMGTQPFYVKKYGRLELPNVSIVDKYGFYVPNNPMLIPNEISFISDIVNGELQ